jgi:exonuclease SbcC
MASPGAPDAAAEKTALRILDDAKATELLHDERVRDLVTRLAVAGESAGDAAPDAVIEERDLLARQLDELHEAGTQAASVQAALAQAEQALEHEQREQRRLEVESAELATSAAGHRAVRDQLAAEIDALLEGTGEVDLDGLLERHTAQAAAAGAATQALVALDGSDAALDRARTALTCAASEAGFESPHAAIGAQLGAAALDALAARVAEHDRRVAAVEAVLASLDSSRIATVEVPDLVALEASHVDALAALGVARSSVALWSTRVDRLTALTAQLEGSLRTWSPIRDDLELTARLAGFVEGKSPDNRLQMRLSAYVLAYRLSQVVAAANERLARMSDQRYSLEHTGRRGAGETRGGLSLLVRDDWSGESRDPATLSGGETFVVSLALALGLADVITQEAGGADLDTLFVDEGFGSLDADTLDDVMDTLDSLRDGGRVVGVVSHVAEMRDRIPTQLLVSKSRHGSTVAVSETT